MLSVYNGYNLKCQIIKKPNAYKQVWIYVDYINNNKGQNQQNAIY